MNLIQTIVLVLHVLVAIAVIGFVLLQHGKGADMGAAFGGGSSGSLFGSAGSANFLSRTTAVLATVFFLTSVALTWFGSRDGSTPQGVMDKGVMERTVVPPAAPSDVPQPAAGGAATGTAATGNAPGGNAAGGTGPAPAAGVPAAPGQGEVPK
jgi:preprotein translocase subunit SecG